MPTTISSIRTPTASVVAVLFLQGAAVHAGGDALEGHSFSVASSQQWRLPDRLNEISGLALTSDARLLAVTDEEAIVYELEFTQGKLVKAFALGDPTLRGDFEGIAYADGRVWLMTSNGVIFEAPEGEDGERVTFDEYPTGLDEYCELEGLAFRQGDRVLLLLCKRIEKNSGLEGLGIFAWSTTSREVDRAKTIMLPDRDIAAALRMNRLNPSGIAIEPQTGNLLIVAARQRAVIELRADGGFLSAHRLPAGAHRQPEGLEVTPAGEILVADEGGEHKARLAIYRPAGQE